MKTKKVLYLGTSGYPSYWAPAIAKQKLILKIFQSLGYTAEILCKVCSSEQEKPYKGVAGNIFYFYTNFRFRRLKNRYLNLLDYPLASAVEKLRILLVSPDVIVIHSRSFFEIFSYFILNKFIKAKLLLKHVEDVDAISGNKLNSFLFNTYAFKLVNGALPISHFLHEQIKGSAPLCPCYKLPVLVDTDEFDALKIGNIQETLQSGYFLFCGAVEYRSVIKFIYDAYINSGVSSKLVLVVAGRKLKVDILKKELESEDVIIYSGIPFSDLISLYKNALALLMPLRETIQDKARFPHKIGEYCASGRPMITNSWGEIPKYFTHLKDSYICSMYDMKSYRDAFKYIEANMEQANVMGVNARKLADEIFNYKFHVNLMQKFIENI